MVELTRLTSLPHDRQHAHDQRRQIAVDASAAADDLRFVRRLQVTELDRASEAVDERDVHLAHPGVHAGVVAATVRVVRSHEHHARSLANHLASLRHRDHALRLQRRMQRRQVLRASERHLVEQDDCTGAHKTAQDDAVLVDGRAVLDTLAADELVALSTAVERHADEGATKASAQVAHELRLAGAGRASQPHVAATGNSRHSSEQLLRVELVQRVERGGCRVVVDIDLVRTVLAADAEDLAQRLASDHLDVGHLDRRRRRRSRDRCEGA